MDSKSLVAFNYSRKFGCEIEVLSSDKRDFILNPLKGKEFPLGTEYIGLLVNKISKETVEIRSWHHTHNNKNWIVKTDRSCGIEICTPVYRGWQGLKKVCSVVDAFSNDENVLIDERCSFHLHVDVSDLNIDQIATVLAYWIKCEAVFLDSVPQDRKINKYCRAIGLSELFDCEEYYSPLAMIKKLGTNKYYTVNCFHLLKGNRSTLEFRILEAGICKDPFAVKNWVRLILHFVETAAKKQPPRAYLPGDRWTSLLWLDPIDIFNILQFNDTDSLSSGMLQVRNWFITRLYNNVCEVEVDGIWSEKTRSIARSQIEQIFDECDLDINKCKSYLHPENIIEAVYAKNLAY